MKTFLQLSTLIAFIVVPCLAFGANPGDIIINEVMQDPAAVSDWNGEWFELYNTTANPIDINGWDLRDNDGELYTISNGGPLIVPRYGYIVLGCNGTPAQNGGYDPDYVYDWADFILGNEYDEIIIVEGSTEIANIEYDNGTTFPDPTGASMGWVGPPTDYQDGNNWIVESTETLGGGDFGTPGYKNTDSSLPVEIAAFVAVQDDEALLVRWVTESEINNSHFNLMRSTARDGEFVVIHSEKGRGNASDPHTYTYRDNTAKYGITYWYKLQAVSYEGDMNVFGPVDASLTTVARPDQKSFKTTTSTNYPNPFNPATTIRFELENDTKVSIKIYDNNGKLVRTLVDNEVKPAGVNRIVWDGKSDEGQVLPSGVYFSRIKSSEFSMIGKMLLLK
jgi:hypothetical protein